MEGVSPFFDVACGRMLFVGFLCLNCSGNYLGWVLLLVFSTGHIIFTEVVILQRLFESVDLDFILPLINELGHHVLYWCINFNDFVLYW